MKFEYTDSPMLKFMEGRSDIESFILNKYGFVNASPELLLFWREIMDKFKPIDIRPLFLEGLLSGPSLSVITTYAEHRVFVALDLLVSASGTFAENQGSTLCLYDEANELMLAFHNDYGGIDGRNDDNTRSASVYTGHNYCALKNLWFSKLDNLGEVAAWDNYRFIGFELLLPGWE